MKTKSPLHAVEFANIGTDLLIFANDLKVGDDGWAMIAPLGDHPGMALLDDGKGGFKKVKAIQRIDAESVTQMVNEFNSGRNGLKKYLNGRPIYVGHPDVPGYEAKYPDKTPKGVFAEVEARADGFYGKPVFTNEGSELVESRKLRALSGRWSAEPSGEENGKQIFRPSVFISAGLTNQPNLPVQLLNESESSDRTAAEQAKTKHMKKSALALLALLGITLANDATDDQVGEALEKTGTDKVKELTGAKTTLANEKQTLEGDLTKEKDAAKAKDGTITTLTQERDTARTNFANDRKARIDGLLALALKEGRITAAEKPDWERRLGVEASFANESEAITKLAPKIKTESVTLQLGERKVELVNERDRATFLNDAIDTICAERKWDRVKDYDKAFAEAQKLHPAVFTAMQSPASGAKKKAA